jgi:hypothetical protein
LLEQLFVVKSIVVDEDVVKSLMGNMPINYKTFISSLKRQSNLFMQSLITDLIEEEISMKILSPTISKSTLYVGKKPTY